MSKQPSSASRVIPPSKTYPVLIELIKPAPAGICQRSKFNKAWGEFLASNLDLNKLGHPVLNHRGGTFFAVDGQHRIYALVKNGFNQKNDSWPCEVFDELTDGEMAEIFLERNNVKHVNSFDKFLVACTAERPRELAIRRQVESHGLKISRGKSEGCIGAVTALIHVYDKCGEIVLGQVLRTLRDAFASESSAFDAHLIEGAGLVFARYNGRTDEKVLAQQLGKVPHGVGGVLRRAEAQRERTGNQKVQCVASTLVEIYNKGAQHSKRLPSWWKQAEAA